MTESIYPARDRAAVLEYVPTTTPALAVEVTLEAVVNGRAVVLTLADTVVQPGDAPLAAAVMIREAGRLVELAVSGAPRA